MGRPKHALPWGDGTMLDAVAAALGRVCRRVVVAGASGAPGSPGAGYPSIADLRPGHGPLGAIEALLASGLDTEYLICPCDLPLVSPEILARLTGAASEWATVFRVAGESDVRPLPVRLSAAALGGVQAQLDRGERAVRDLLRRGQPREIVLGPTDARWLADVNGPSDYTEALHKARDAIRVLADSAP
jgi:molybdopterin-guanine dinucleotide biosynthesis protein A